MWFKVDDNLMSSDKVLSIPRRDGRRMAALGLWTAAGSWSAKRERDGYVPEFMVEELGAEQEQADDLVASGLWEAIDGGYQFHNWGQYQPTRDKLEAKREATRQRVAAWRERQDATVTNSVDNIVSNSAEPSSNSVTNAGVTLPPNPTRTRPEPDPNPVTPIGVTSGESAPSAPPAPKSKRGTRIAEGWMPKQETIDAMREEAPWVDLETEHRKFADYWAGVPGAKGVKLDWEATWRNWIRRAAEQFPGSTPGQASRVAPSRATRMERADDMIDQLERMEQSR